MASLPPFRPGIARCQIVRGFGRCTWRVALSLMGMSVLAGAQQVAGEDASPHSAVELVGERAGIAPGGTLTAAVRVTLDAGWHTYWTNGGDAGLPISVVWTLPAGITAGPLRFPRPHLLPQPPLMSYGYETDVLFLVDFHADNALQPGAMTTIRAAAEWLACADVCLPASGTATLALPVAATERVASLPAAPVFRAARAAMPASRAEVRGAAWRRAEGYLLVVTGARSPDGDPGPPYFFADSAGVVDHFSPQLVAQHADTMVLAVKKSRFASPDANRLGGVLAWPHGADTGPSFVLQASLQSERESTALYRAAVALLASTPLDSSGGARSLAAATAGSPLAPVPPVDDAAGASLGLLAAALFAFVGGLLLNLMPCVFPVLSVKVLSLVELGAGETRRTFRHALTFALGVLVTLWAMVGMLLALRAGGTSLGWGFQLQSPMVIAVLALVMFGLALNLSGAFEVGLSLTRLGGIGAGKGLGDSFLTGALAVIVATPCTAPFMGAAIGYALVQPPAVALTVFTALGTGLAAPYVLLASVPSLLRRLPRPGAWLETFKQALAFPMYATVVWLLWVFGQQAGVDALAVLLLALTLTAFAGWAWGRASRSGSRVLRSVAVGAMLLAVGAAWRGSVGRTVASAASPSAHGEVAWEPFSPEALASHRAAGRPVFVDFTAAWCLSCQVNERVALQVDRVQAKFTEANVVLLRADWTSRDTVIANVLGSHGRSGVPLYVLYPASDAAPPEILPTILTPGIVMAAVERARS